MMRRPLPDEWSSKEMVSVRKLSDELKLKRERELHSCPSCERTREIISSRINAAQCNQKWEVLDALKEIQEQLSAGRTSTT